MAFLRNFFKSDYQTNVTKSVFNDLELNKLSNIVQSRSVINNAVGACDGTPTSPFYFSDADEVLPLLTNKTARLNQYRAMAGYPEIQWCLDEIANELIQEDDAGNVITCRIKNDNKLLDNYKIDIIQNEFNKFVKLFNISYSGYQLFYQYLITGELAWENIINPEIPSAGIIGVRPIPVDIYEYAIDRYTGEKRGLIINLEKLKEIISYSISPTYGNSQSIFNTLVSGGCGYDFSTFTNGNSVFFPWSQVTYVPSIDFSDDGVIPLSILEKCKQAYYQLLLMQDSAVILRVTRAPERLVFNINTGGMSDKVAENYIRQFGNKLKSKKTILGAPTSTNSNIVNKYNPSTMLETWIFGKSNANDGTDVSSVSSQAAYDQIDDIKYFLKRLIKQFKVPWSRFETSDVVIDKQDLSYEEYSFTKMIVRYQHQIEKAIFDSFVVHLKLRQIWDAYNLTTNSFDIRMTPPSLYEIINKQRQLEGKLTTYSLLADRDEFSKILAMKRILGMNDSEIEENFKNISREKLLMAQSTKYEEDIGASDNVAEDLANANKEIDSKDDVLIDTVTKEIVNSGELNTNNADTNDGDADSSIPENPFLES